LNTKKFFAAASCIISKKNSGSNGAGMGWPLMLRMMLMSSDGKAGIFFGTLVGLLFGTRLDLISCLILQPAAELQQDTFKIDFLVC
jgi:hypothetical protein